MISIVTLSFNALDVLKKCIESVRELTSGVDWEWVIADNGSDGTYEYISNLKDLRIKCVKNDNKGNFSTMNNKLVNLCKGKYLCFLNNDVEFLSNLLKDTGDLLVSDPQVGVVGSTLYYPNGKLQHAGILISKNLIPINISHSVLNRIHHKTTRYTREFQAITGACLLCRKEDFLKVGGFTEEYNWAYEDVDLCLKIKYNLNKKVILCSEASAIHYESYSKANPNIPPNLKIFKDTWQSIIFEDEKLYSLDGHNLYPPQSPELIKYRNFEVPREDNRIGDEDLLLEKDKTIRLKKYIIKLRRFPNKDDFARFDNFLKDNLDYFIELFETRELVSIVDCYADLGSDLEKGLALSISCFINQEKIFQTMRGVFDQSFKKIEENKLFFIKGNTHSIRLAYDDALVNFIKRMSNSVKNSKILFSIWKKVLRNHLADQDTALSQVLFYCNPQMRWDTLKEIHKMFNNSDMDLITIQRKSFNYGK